MGMLATSEERKIPKLLKMSDLPPPVIRQTDLAKKKVRSLLAPWISMSLQPKVDGRASILVPILVSTRTTPCLRTRRQMFVTTAAAAERGGLFPHRIYPGGPACHQDDSTCGIRRDCERGEDSNRTRKYLAATDLSGEAQHALESLGGLRVLRYFSFRAG